nr:uncharacterized protein LOC112709438 [Arachis hypogaea]
MQIGSAAAFSVSQINGLISSSGGTGAAPTSSLRPFRPPRIKPPPPINSAQYSEPPDEDLDPKALKRKRRKTIEFWDVKTIESDGTIKQLHLSVREAMKPPNGRKIVPRFNNRLQPVGNEASILSGVVEMLGSDYTKFSICEKDWKKELFHFEEDNGRIIKQAVHRELLQIIGDGFLIIATVMKQRRSVGKMLRIDRSSYTLIPADRKVWQGSKKKSRNDRGVQLVGELFVLTHKRSNGSYLHDAARAIGVSNVLEIAMLFLIGFEKIAKIEQRDESSRLLSQNDSLAQALGKEHPGRVRGMGIGPTTSQVFDSNSAQPIIGTQMEETQRVLLELQAELAAEKLKRKAMESALMCLVRGQGGELPPNVAAWINSLEGQSRE